MRIRNVSFLRAMSLTFERKLGTRVPGVELVAVEAGNGADEDVGAGAALSEMGEQSLGDFQDAKDVCFESLAELLVSTQC